MSGLGSMMRDGHHENPFIRAHTKSPVTLPFFEEGAVAATEVAPDVGFNVVFVVDEVDFVVIEVVSVGLVIDEVVSTVVAADMLAVEDTLGVGVSVDPAERSSFLAFSFSADVSTEGSAAVVVVGIIGAVNTVDSDFISVSIAIDW